MCWAFLDGFLAALNDLSILVPAIKIFCSTYGTHTSNQWCGAGSVVEPDLPRAAPFCWSRSRNSKNGAGAAQK